MIKELLKGLFEFDQESTLYRGTIQNETPVLYYSYSNMFSGGHYDVSIYSDGRVVTLGRFCLTTETKRTENMVSPLQVKDIKNDLRKIGFYSMKNKYAPEGDIITVFDGYSDSLTLNDIGRSKTVTRNTFSIKEYDRIINKIKELGSVNRF
ncbi:MAG: hypothetical protein EPN85_10280 [Bacteroidetes bacterium]|nr:MAG: hypothetical protein EPN85_10280 [Bacteroidota bacterium]